MNTTFNQLPIGALFRALRNDVLGSGDSARVINNNGMYAKVGHNVAVDLTKGNKDCVFLLGMPVRRVETKAHVDISLLDSFKACAAGGNNAV